MQSNIWLGRLARAVLFFALALCALCAVRVAFFYAYRSTSLAFDAFWPALVMGIRVDAKWLALALVPAWLSLLVSFWRASFWKVARICAALGYGAVLVLAVVNFGFYGFYGTPISPIIFGFFQDDTWAIVQTLWQDWPVARYAAALLILLALPWIGTYWVPEQSRFTVKWPVFAGLALGLTLCLGLIIRGSLGTFPLRNQDYSVSANAFVNATVPGGCASLYEAYKGQKALLLQGSADDALKQMGFAGFDQAQAALQALRPKLLTNDLEYAPPPQPRAPHVVVAIMESMGRDAMDAYRAGQNDTLGALSEQLTSAVVFKQGICIGSGTFPSLEGILLDTPLTPITQSRYGNRQLSTSRVLAFKKAGYETIFLTAGPESWRQIDRHFGQQGFDRVLGAAYIKEHYPQAEMGTWGIGDKWMFQTALDLLEQADQSGKKLCIVMLSASNHPPFRVPDATAVNSVRTADLPAIVIDRDKIDPVMLQTYQYASDQLGRFVQKLKAEHKTREAVIVATGDHNLRWQYEPQGYWHHLYGVPVIFWLPESLASMAERAQPQRWVGHRDIFPTLSALVLGTRPALHEGRNLFDRSDDFDLANSFTGWSKSGFAIGSWGAVSLDGDRQPVCYRWDNDRLVAMEQCTGLAAQMAVAARAQRALADYTIRKSLLQK